MIEFKDVKKYNGTVALDGIDLKIADGEFVFIVGESGAGKTTLMKLLLREEKITSGSLIVRSEKQVGNKIQTVDYNLSKLSNFRVPYYRRELGVVFQDFRLFPNKTVFENVALRAMQVVGESSRVIKRRVPALLSIVNLTDKYRSYPTQLAAASGQRVALARALANNPQIIIADEPTGNIDPKMSLEIMNLLIKIRQARQADRHRRHSREGPRRLFQAARRQDL